MVAATALGRRAAGATGDAKQDEAMGKVLEFGWWMKKNGYKESTIESRIARLSRLIKHGACLSDPESVKEVIARQDGWSVSGKEGMVYAYDLFAKWAGLKWERPRYKPPRRYPFIPTEREIDDLIAGCNKEIAAFLQAAKETGARAGELFGLKWIDIDFENRRINITPEKGGDPRVLNVSDRLLGMLNGLVKTDERVFSRYKSLGNLRRTFERYRKRIAHSLANPRLLEISLHTFRHWRATTAYRRTKDILYVKEMLGHRSLSNTLKYIHLAGDDPGTDEYVSKVARTIDEARALIEAGFEYVCEVGGAKIFRKRK
ncbi:MAG: site-specific integrase [Candidatus Jordarchaeaceae archaeon]